MFATRTDVADRFEGTIPDGRSAWVDTKIADVEEILLALVPSLADEPVGSPRWRRATILVCDKVLELYRNPDGTTQRSQVMGPFTDTKSYSSATNAGRITFTADELRPVRAPRRRRNLGVARTLPWGVPR